MPIVGLTDRAASFPRIGVLRKGGEKVSDRQPGKDLSFFRFDTEDVQAAQQFIDAYGAEPRAIRIYLPYDSVEENFVTWQEHWAAGGLMHRCDGQVCVMRRLKDGTGYDRSPAPCPHIALPRTERDRCRPVGRLSVIIPELKRLAYVTALTHSIHDIISLTEQLTALHQMTAAARGGHGSLRGIPMILRRTEREISMPDNKGGRVRRAKWLLSIEAAPHWVGLQLEAQERAALPVVAQPLALPVPQSQSAGWADDEDDTVIIGPARRLATPPPAPPVDEDGVVLENEKPSITGLVTSVELRYNGQGVLFVHFSLNGQPYLIKSADEALAHLQDGDEVDMTFHVEVSRGREYLVVDTIDGTRNADGLTDWEERAAVADTGAAFEAVAEPAL